MSTAGAGESEGSYDLTPIKGPRNLRKDESMFLELWQTKRTGSGKQESVDFECVQFEVIDRPTLF